MGGYRQVGVSDNACLSEMGDAPVIVIEKETDVYRANRAMTLFTPVCTYVDRVRSAEVLQYQCMVYRASKHHSVASPHDCFSKC